MDEKKCSCPFCDDETKENLSGICYPCSNEPVAEYDQVLDCTGLYCPAPVFETRKKIDEMKKDEVLLMMADDPASEEDIKAWTRRTGNELLSINKDEDVFSFLIKKS
ncbi:MAG TPA: sulfurtransferase TusA family protein [Actinobacteria bacterium]|jgi:tRNA 2-thiouridine synthesizing protein A|nr:sulfurtransferase TusA family protein [Actinomycetota bacterium]